MSELARHFPDAVTLRSRSRVLATLDAVVSPDWESRYFSYDSSWGEGEQLASMRTGSGDEYSIVFTDEGVFVRGFDHESVMSPKRVESNSLWPGVVDSVPRVFRQFVEEPAFSDGTTPLITVCLWQLSGADEVWVHGEIDFPRGVEDPDGANWLFDSLTDYSPLSYLRFARDCYHVDLEAGPVAEIYALSPMSRALARSLNPALSFEVIVQELEGIGYPVAE